MSARLLSARIDWRVALSTRSCTRRGNALSLVKGTIWVHRTNEQACVLEDGWVRGC
jgi:hypothetical protein